MWIIVYTSLIILVLTCSLLYKEYFTKPMPLNDWVYEEVVNKFPEKGNQFVQITDP